jgi:hypothetical protein
MKPLIKFTETIPICPVCKKPTVRIEGYSTTTDMYFPPTFNEKGENINPDRNIITRSYICKQCGTQYKIFGNNIDGYEYDVSQEDMN